MNRVLSDYKVPLQQEVSENEQNMVRKEGIPLWIPLFLMVLLLVSGLPGWFLFEYLPPILHKLGSPPLMPSSLPSVWPGSYSIITASFPPLGNADELYAY